LLVVLPESVRRLLVLASLVFSLPFRERGSPLLVVLSGLVRFSSFFFLAFLKLFYPSLAVA
jgi:hypothetical protein